MQFNTYFLIVVLQAIIISVLFYFIIIKRKNSRKSVFPEYDFLTGIYSRGTAQMLVSDRLKHYSLNTTSVSAAAASTDKTALDALLIMDLDGFKNVNDRCGHPAGDELLKLFAHILTDSMRKSDIIGRLGGDEFLVFMSRISSSEHACEKAAKICEIFEKSADCLPYDCGNITVSIGISFAPFDGTDFDMLYQHADSALYCAKGSGKNCYRTFEEIKCQS